MTLKRLLIFIPLLLIAGLLQSYFWVPTYENQTTGNPQRLRKYIEGSTADAQILNPILNADTASSNITGYVFEGLLDLDENLNLRGRLATDWHITENAYLLVNPQKRLPDGTPATGPELVQRITRALESGNLPKLTGVLLSVRLLPPESRTQTLTLAEKDAQGRPAPAKIAVTVEVPERLAFSLSRVDQDFFTRLQPILGEHYLEDFPYEQHLRLMYDMMALAFQSDTTRIATFITAHDGDDRPYPFIGVSDGHHTLSHHQNDQAKKEKIAKINRFHTEQFAYFLDKLKSVKEGNGFQIPGVRGS